MHDLLSSIASILSKLVAPLQALESAITVLGIGAGLWWFYKRREKAPRANVEHEVQFIDLKNGTTYVGVHVHVKNTGKVAIRPKVESDATKTSAVIIEELMPYLSKKLESQELSPEYKMDFLGSRTFPPKICIEPGETQPLLFEFVVQSTTRVVKVYSHINNSYTSGIGWDTTTIHEVQYGRQQSKKSHSRADASEPKNS